MGVRYGVKLGDEFVIPQSLQDITGWKDGDHIELDWRYGVIILSNITQEDGHEAVEPVHVSPVDDTEDF